jgi:ABC-2 type transport system ATP-binding protein/ribosome-dependent ATPase
MQEAQECDRLLLMSNGKLVAEGSEAEIIGETTALAVQTEDWAAAFAALNAAGVPVILDGRAVRVPDADPDELDRTLKAAGLTATVEPVAATIEERMLVLARDTHVA